MTKICIHSHYVYIFGSVGLYSFHTKNSRLVQINLYIEKVQRICFGLIIDRHLNLETYECQSYFFFMENLFNLSKNEFLMQFIFLNCAQFLSARHYVYSQNMKLILNAASEKTFWPNWQHYLSYRHAVQKMWIELLVKKAKKAYFSFS